MISELRSKHGFTNGKLLIKTNLAWSPVFWHRRLRLKRSKQRFEKIPDASDHFRKRWSGFRDGRLLDEGIPLLNSASKSKFLSVLPKLVSHSELSRPGER